MFEFEMTPASGSRVVGHEHDSDDIFEENETEGESDDLYQQNHRPTESKSVFQRLHIRHALHSLTADEASTFSAMLTRDDHAEVHIMPTHRIHLGNVKGFRLVVDKQSDCMNLPVTREMFRGSTCVECDPGDRDIHPDVIRLLSNSADVKQSVLKVLATISEFPPEMNVGFEHMPVYGETDVVAVTADDNCTGKERTEILLENLISERIGHHSTTMRGRDSRLWKCDMPTSVGVYHAHVRSRDSGRRHHKLFIVVSGGCRKASEQFYNMNLDLLGNATAGELESCEESWWLRRTSCRSRCKTIQMVADALQLQVPTSGDVFDFEDGASLPVFTTDTMDHNISETDDGRIALFNECCDSTSVSNGILCRQHPSEGVWIFQGSQQSAIGSLSNFGGSFGHQEHCGAFPTGTFSLHEESYQLQSHPISAMQQQRTDTMDKQGTKMSTTSYTRSAQQLSDTRLNLFKEKESNHVVYFDPLTGKEIDNMVMENEAHYVKMDETFLKHLESHDWCREYQIIQLIPILHAIETSPVSV
jgi:hypothetical protein